MVRLFMILLVLLFSFGCAPMETSKKTDQPELFPVDFLDDKIVDALTLIDHRSERLPSGHVDVMLRCLSNKDAKPLWIDWKVLFFDSRNITVEESEWRTEYLAPRLDKTLQVSSIRNDVASFRFLIRTPIR
jgi:uncharacterized protein YcfL